MRKALSLLGIFFLLGIFLLGLTGCGGTAANTPSNTIGGDVPSNQQGNKDEGDQVQPTSGAGQTAVPSQAAEAEPTPLPTETQELDFFDGIWIQKDGSDTGGYYAFLFKDGKVYLGLKGDSLDEILRDAHGLGGMAAGFPYQLESDKIIVSLPDDTTLEWKRSVDTFWIGTGVAHLEDSGATGPSTMVSVSVDGEYEPEGE